MPHVRSRAVQTADPIATFCEPAAASLNFSDSNFIVLNRWSRGVCRAVSASGRYAFIGNGLMFSAIDIAVPDSPRFLSELLLGSITNDVKIRDTVAIVATGPRLYVVNVSNPHAMRVVSQLVIPGICTRLELSDSLAFVLTSSSGLKVIDLSNIVMPFIRNSIGAGGGQAATMAGRGRFLYVGNPIVNDIGVYNCLNPDNIIRTPFVIGAFADYTYSSDTLLFVSARSFGGIRTLRIFSIAQPTNPRLISQTDFRSDISAIALNDSNLFLATRDSGLVLMNVRDLSHPTTVNRLERIVRPGYGGRAIFVVGSIILDAFESGLWITRTVNGELRDLSFHYTGSSPGRLGTDENFVFVSQVSSGLLILETAGATLKLRSAVEFAGGSFDLTQTRNLLFCLGVAGLTVVDVQNKSQPRVLAQRQIGGDLRTISNRGHIVCVARYDSGLVILDASNPSDPKIVGSYFTRGGVLDVAVLGSIAYLAIIDSGVVLLDLSNPALPSRINRVLTSSTGMSIRDNFLYVATDTGLAILNVEDARNPRHVGATRTSGSRSSVDVAVGSRTAYLAYDGIHAVDISNACCPREVAVFASPTMTPSAVALSNDTVFAADAFSIYQLTFGQTTAVEEELQADLRSDFDLEQNYPNPFNGATTIRFQLNIAMVVRLEIYDVLGRKVKTLVEGNMSAGEHSIQVNDQSLSSGVYFYRLHAGSTFQTKKLLVLN
jgi:hypothetical protein